MGVSALLHLLALSLYPYSPSKGDRYRVYLVPWKVPYSRFSLPVGPISRRAELLQYSPPGVHRPPPSPPSAPILQVGPELPVLLDTLPLFPEVKVDLPPEELAYRKLPEVPRPPRFDWELELLSMADVERGRIRRFVVVHPDDRRALEGSLLLARTTRGRLLDRLADYINRHTLVRARVTQEYAPIPSQTFQNSPIAFVGFQQEEYRDTLGVGIDTLKSVPGASKQDVALLGEYLLRGGFLVLAKIEQYDQLRRHLKEEYGGKFKFFKFLNSDDPSYPGYSGPVRGLDHPLFHAFYDINVASLYEAYRGRNVKLVSVYRRYREPFCFEGIELNGRLVAFAPYIVPLVSDTVEISPEVLLGVNLVAFALAQPGGKGYRLVRHVKPPRSYEGEPEAYLALVGARGLEPVEVREVRVFLDGVLLEGVWERKVVLFGPLLGGKRKLRLAYRGTETVQEVLLKGKKVVRVAVGFQRILWIRRLKAYVEGEAPALLRSEGP